MIFPKKLILPTNLFIKALDKPIKSGSKTIGVRRDDGINLADWISFAISNSIIKINGLDKISNNTIVTNSENDIITDHYSDTNSATYYYYGYNRNGNWEFLRNLKSNINTEQTATKANNTGILSLTQAITNRVTLNYI